MDHPPPLHISRRGSNVKRIFPAVLLAASGIVASPSIASPAPCPEGVPDAGGGCSTWIDSSTGAKRAYVCHTSIFFTCGGGDFWTQAPGGMWMTPGRCHNHGSYLL